MSVRPGWSVAPNKRFVFFLQGSDAHIQTWAWPPCWWWCRRCYWPRSSTSQRASSAWGCWSLSSPPQGCSVRLAAPSAWFPRHHGATCHWNNTDLWQDGENYMLHCSFKWKSVWPVCSWWASSCPAVHGDSLIRWVFSVNHIDRLLLEDWTISSSILWQISHNN